MTGVDGMATDILEELDELIGHVDEVPEKDPEWSLPNWAPQYEINELYHVAGSQGENRITEETILASPLFIYLGATMGKHTQIHVFRSLNAKYKVACSDIQAKETVLPVRDRERKALKWDLRKLYVRT